MYFSHGLKRFLPPLVVGDISQLLEALLVNSFASAANLGMFLKVQKGLHQIAVICAACWTFTYHL